MKYFRMSYEEVVFKRSYITIMLLNRSIPSFGSIDKDKVDGGYKRTRTPSKTHNKITKPISANDFFMGMM